MASLAQETEQALKIKQQMDRVAASAENENEGGEGSNTNAAANVDFDSLINLSAIAEKAKEQKIKREERLKRGEINVFKLYPFNIPNLVKEDLNIVLYKDLAGQRTPANDGS